MMLFDYAGGADTADGGNHDPKWGIYRSLNTRSALRDEQVRFADFCISKTSAADCEADGPAPPPPGDAGGNPEPQDAGAAADSGTKPQDAAPGDPERDAAVVTPPPPQPDAATSPPKGEADASTQPPTKRDAAAPPSTPSPPAGAGAAARPVAAASPAAGWVVQWASLPPVRDWDWAWSRSRSRGCGAAGTEAGRDSYLLRVRVLAGTPLRRNRCRALDHGRCARCPSYSSSCSPHR